MVHVISCAQSRCLDCGGPMRSMIAHPHPQVVIECWDGLRTSSKDASDCASV
jgi:hypothetical protein